MIVSRLVKLFAPALLVSGALFAACSGSEGVTPDCNYNVGERGVYFDEDGCERFAVCSKAPNDPAKCCTDSKGKPLTDSALTTCLYGFGVIPDGGLGGSNTGGSNTGGSSAGGSGTGGAGTGGS
jgi:hypothetical protein